MCPEAFLHQFTLSTADELQQKQGTKAPRPEVCMSVAQEKAHAMGLFLSPCTSITWSASRMLGTADSSQAMSIM